MEITTTSVSLALGWRMAEGWMENGVKTKAAEND